MDEQNDNYFKIQYGKLLIYSLCGKCIDFTIVMYWCSAIRQNMIYTNENQHKGKYCWIQVTYEN